MALHLAVEEDAVRHCVVEIRIEMEGLVDATRGPDVVAESQERRAFVAPRGRMLRPHPQDLVVAGDRSAVIPEFVKGRPLVDPRLDGPRVDLEQAVVRLSLLLGSADLV